MFRDVQRATEKGQRVLFVGTPCQCAALVSFAELKKISKEKLLIVDCVCHGVPGRVSWLAYKDSLTRKEFTLSSVNMRDKRSPKMSACPYWLFSLAF